jgi:hypothetical protein
MSYTEIFNRFKEPMEKSRNAVCSHIQYLLKPDEGYPKGSDEHLKNLYNIWRADCRAMDAACEETWYLSAKQPMIEMPPDDEEHILCRRMAAVIIERYIYGEISAQQYLPKLVREIKMSNCHTHPHTCACHSLRGWTYANQELLNTLSTHYAAKQHGFVAPPALRRSNEHVLNCACSACHNKRVADGTQEAYMRDLQARVDEVLGSLKKEADPPSSLGTKAENEIDFAKNLFQIVQGVKYDDKCPHDLPFYACMPCSH